MSRASEGISSDKEQRIFQAATIAALAMLVHRLPIWLSQNFGFLDIEQLLFHVQNHVGGTPWKLIRGLLREVILKPAIVFALTCLIITLGASLSASISKWAKRLIIIFSVVSIILSTYRLYYVTGISEYFSSKSESWSKNKTDWMTEYYVYPSTKPNTHDRHVNLIWIYVESLQTQRINPEIHKTISKFGTAQVNAFHNLPGTGWTIAGMVSSQCGIPLLPVGLFAGNGFSDSQTFMPGAECLGDILSRHGYTTEFIGGADTAFAGKGTFLKSHGYQEILGRTEIQARTGLPYPKEFWGYTDDVVLRLAVEEILRLKNTGKPFFLSALTVDTHAPHGYLSDHCKSRGHSPNLQSIFDCSISQVEVFIEALSAARVLENTVLIISGDHPMMEGEDLSTSLNLSERKKNNLAVFYGISRPDGKRLTSPVMNHFDMLPVALDSIGFAIENDSAGLGRNLFATDSLSASHPPEHFSSILRSNSKKYLELWGRKPD